MVSRKYQITFITGLTVVKRVLGLREHITALTALCTKQDTPDADLKYRQ